MSAGWPSKPCGGTAVGSQLAEGELCRTTDPERVRRRQPGELAMALLIRLAWQRRGAELEQVEGGEPDRDVGERLVAQWGAVVVLLGIAAFLRQPESRSGRRRCRRRSPCRAPLADPSMGGIEGAVEVGELVGEVDAVVAGEHGGAVRGDLHAGPVAVQLVLNRPLRAGAQPAAVGLDQRRSDSVGHAGGVTRSHGDVPG